MPSRLQREMATLWMKWGRSSPQGYPLAHRYMGSPRSIWKGYHPTPLCAQLVPLWPCQGADKDPVTTRTSSFVKNVTERVLYRKKHRCPALMEDNEQWMLVLPCIKGLDERETGRQLKTYITEHKKAVSKEALYIRGSANTINTDPGLSLNPYWAARRQHANSDRHWCF